MFIIDRFFYDRFFVKIAAGYSCSGGSATDVLNNTEIIYRLSQTIYAVATGDVEVGGGVEPNFYKHELPDDILSFMISVNY